jgi:pimeloyl-ACP methyl ester carboxylesterase
MPSSRDVIRTAGAVAASAAGAALTLAALNRIVSRTAPSPLPPLGRAPERFAWTDGEIAYSVAGQGPAVILLHGIYAGASSFEFRRTFPLFARHWRVYAPDLPGCGLSDRPKQAITPELYIRCINDLTRMVAGGADHPVTLVASSLTGAYAVEAVADAPNLYGRLVLIEPTGLQERHTEPGIGQRAAGALMQTPLIGTTLYHLLASRAGLRAYLRQVYLRRDDVTDDLIDEYYAVSHLPGARRPIARFIGGHLNLDVSETFARLDLPILLCWGSRAKASPLARADAFLDANRHAELAIFDHSSAWPHDEEASDFVEQVEHWLRPGISSRF